MKKTVTLLVVLLISVTQAQKKANGTIYVDHPAIKTVEDMTKAFVAGDEKKVAGFLADDFVAYNGVSTKTNDKGTNKTDFLKSVKGWYDALDYYSITRWPGAYPDALEYKDDSQKDVVWVQTWEQLKGVHKKTGVKVDMPIHRLYTVDKNNKIKMVISYLNESVPDEIGDSYTVRTNGTIYNHHDFINTVRSMVYAFEHKDFNKAYSFYDAEARFGDINKGYDVTISLEEQKAEDKKMFDAYDVVSVDMVGYPDYFHYELGDAHVVQSWWTINLMRKSDKKAITMPMMLVDDFNKDGKIVREMAYYSNDGFMDQGKEMMSKK